MKKIVSFVLILAGMFGVQAQDSVIYRSVIGDSVSRWAGSYVRGYNGDIKELHQVCYSNDTVFIDSVAFFRLEDDYGFFFSFGFDCDAFYIRESESHDKLYGKMKIKQYDTTIITSEFLITDLSLDVGDTLNTDSWHDVFIPGNPQIPTIVVDSVYYWSGRKHLRTNFINRFIDYCDLHYDTLTFIEGVGPNKGIPYIVHATIPSGYLNPHCYYSYDSCWKVTPMINCFWRDTTEEYHREWVYVGFGEYWYLNGPCYFDQRGFEEFDIVKENMPNIAPNPTYGELAVSNIPSGKCKVSIFDLYGRERYSAFTESDTIYIDMQKLQAGVYLLVLETASGLITRKVVKL